MGRKIQLSRNLSASPLSGASPPEPISAAEALLGLKTDRLVGPPKDVNYGKMALEDRQWVWIKGHKKADGEHFWSNTNLVSLMTDGKKAPRKPVDKGHFASAMTYISKQVASNHKMKTFRESRVSSGRRSSHRSGADLERE
jgi:hypothetical protein